MRVILKMTTESLILSVDAGQFVKEFSATDHKYTREDTREVIARKEQQHAPNM